jgi:hypothetical protein
MTSPKHFWSQPPPCGSRNYQSPVQRCASTAIPVLRDFRRLFQLPYDSKCSSPSMAWYIQAPNNGETSRRTLYMARCIGGFPHLNMACWSYQGTKVTFHTVTPLGDFTLLAARFLHVHLDLIGPLPNQQTTHTASLQWTVSPTCQKSFPSRTSQPIPWHTSY